MLENDRRRAQGVEQIVELDRQDRLGGGQRYEVQARLDQHPERSFRSDDQLREVARLIGIDERVQVVSTDPAQDVRKTPPDLGGVLGPEAADLAITAALERVCPADRLQLVRVQRTQVRDGSVAQGDVQIEHVVNRLAVQHRSGAAGVVADHAADGGAVGGRDVRREAQPVGEQPGVQLVEHDARFDPRPALVGVHLEDAVEVLGRVELQPGADRLTGLRGAAAARRDRDAVAARDRDGADDVLARADDDDAGRIDLIDAGVGRVQRSGDGVEADFAVEGIRQVALQRIGHGGEYTLGVRSSPAPRGSEKRRPARWSRPGQSGFRRGLAESVIDCRAELATGG